MSDNIAEFVHSEELDRTTYIIDISSGFPVNNAIEFNNLLKSLLRNHRISRLPIIATPDSILTLIDLSDEHRQEHRNLIDKANVNPNDIIWTSSIENATPDKLRDPHTPCLDLDLGSTSKCIRVGMGSDLMVSNNNKVPGWDPNAMKELFVNVEGVTPQWD